MTPLFFSIGSVEFYVFLVVVAAAVVSLAIRPSGRGEAVQYFAEGILLKAEGDADGEPHIYIECLESGDVAIRRTGLEGVGRGGAVSLAITRIGFDLTIDERVVKGGEAEGDEPDTAIFTIDFLAPERYHVKYNAGDEGRFVAFSLSVKPGMWVKKSLPVRS